ncbi:MAG: hypothetical protein QOK38_440 [Acidobacteriaceae bacterium]|nr:hypothetical protein [Acidobacteriaceae bacterium]
MKTIVQFRLRQEGGDLRWKNPKIYESHETPEFPNIGEFVSPPGSVGGGECRVTEITELISREIDNEVTTITVILRRAAK